MYKLNDAEMFYDMADGQAVVINFISGCYYGTNNLGSEVLDRLLKGYDVQKITDGLKTLPGCPENIGEQVDKFIADLKDKNIVVSGETEPGGDEPFDKSLAEGGFDINIVEYREVQNLILADPIHEVEENAGWPVMKKEQ